MIFVNVTFIDKCISDVRVTGHANYAKYNHDIVCAGVSAIVIGAINAISIDYKENLLIEVLEGDIHINVLKKVQRLNTMLNMMYIQLQSIEETYPKNIKIKNIHGGA